MTTRRRLIIVIQLTTVVVVTALVGSLLYRGLSNGQGKSPAAPMVSVASDFTSDPDGPAPSRFDTGQSALISRYAQFPGSTLRVSGGLLTFAPTSRGISAGYYSTPDLGAPVTNISASWRFRPGRGSSTGAVALVVSTGVQTTLPQVVPPLAFHLVVTEANWNLSVRMTPVTTLESIASGFFARRLPADAKTTYSVACWIIGGRAVLDLPDGSRKVVNDPRISRWIGHYATFETYVNDARQDSLAGFASIEAGTDPSVIPPARKVAD